MIAYYAAHREQGRAKSRRYYQKNKDARRVAITGGTA